MKKIVQIIFIFSTLFASFNVKAQDNDNSLWGKFKVNASQTWQEGDYNLFIPINTWHNRLTYDKEKIEKYNEMPWGLGLGKGRYDKEGDWHGLYAIVFEDSNYHPQTIFGYAYQKNWFVGCNTDFRVGAGFTISLTQREEYSYIPVPLPLPLAGIEYQNWAIQAAYVPGLKNNGNVLFTWLRYRF